MVVSKHKAKKKKMIKSLLENRSIAKWITTDAIQYLVQNQHVAEWDGYRLSFGSSVLIFISSFDLIRIMFINWTWNLLFFWI